MYISRICQDECTVCVNGMRGMWMQNVNGECNVWVCVCMNNQMSRSGRTKMARKTAGNSECKTRQYSRKIVKKRRKTMFSLIYWCQQKPSLTPEAVCRSVCPLSARLWCITSVRWRARINLWRTSNKRLVIGRCCLAEGHQDRLYLIEEQVSLLAFWDGKRSL